MPTSRKAVDGFLKHHCVGPAGECCPSARKSPAALTDAAAQPTVRVLGCWQPCVRLLLCGSRRFGRWHVALLPGAAARAAQGAESRVRGPVNREGFACIHCGLQRQAQRTTQQHFGLLRHRWVQCTEVGAPTMNQTAEDSWLDSHLQ